MVAEPVAETEQPIAEAEDVTPSDPTPESAPEDDISDEDLSSFLKEQGIIEDAATGGGEGGGAQAKDSGPNLEGLTPQQILDLGKKQGKSELQAETQASTAAYQTQRQRDGLVATVSNARQALEDMAVNAGVDLQTARQMARQIDAVNGAWNTIYQTDMGGAQGTAQTAFRNGMMDAAEDVLGSKGFAERHQDTRSTKAFLKDFADEYIRQGGYLSPSDAKKQNADTMRQFIKKLPKEARDAIGFNQASTMNTSAAESTGGNLTFARLMALPPEEYEKVPVATRNRLALQEQARRARSGV